MKGRKARDRASVGTPVSKRIPRIRLRWPRAVTTLVASTTLAWLFVYAGVDGSSTILADALRDSSFGPTGVAAGTADGGALASLPAEQTRTGVAVDDFLELANADLTEEDLPLDAAGHSARDGRKIPGVLPRREAPAELKKQLADLKVTRTTIAAAVPESVGKVTVPDLDGARYAPHRLDSGASDPERRSIALEMPEAQ